ncbi:MAG: redoxin domain-containing protein [Planctomycetes bacterium]|nr:redoxin domain-containing protein [Planctomycetota bacterium]
MTPEPGWPKYALRLAAIHNWLWGTWVILRPNQLFDLMGMDRPNHPWIWQSVGMLVAVFGIGYWLAASDFRRHWPIVLMGLIGKMLGPVGFFQSAITGQVPWSLGPLLLIQDIPWWFPLGSMLYMTFRDHSDPKSRTENGSLTELTDWTLEQANALAIATNGKSIAEMSAQQDVLLVFLRHAGCTFCRETLDELRSTRSTWSGLGMLPVVVHMGSDEESRGMMQRFDLADLPTISDPDCRLFRAYQLPRGSISQLFGWNVWVRGFIVAIVKGYGFGKIRGDGFQLSGAFLVRHGKIIKGNPSKDAADSCPWKPIVNESISSKSISV